jgi:uncharacterized protein with NRDE domain
MGVSRHGKFAAVTNYRGATEPSAPESRGALVTGFLANGAAPAAYIREVGDKAGRYSGFNLLVADRDELWWMSNRDGTPRKLEPGYHALGNLLLDSPDVQPVKQKVAELPPATEALFTVLGGAKIVNERYGTRCSTVLLDSGGEIRYAERTFQPDGADGETRHFNFAIRGRSPI